jgi:hypothetical protein
LSRQVEFLSKEIGTKENDRRYSNKSSKKVPIIFPGRGEAINLAGLKEKNRKLWWNLEFPKFLENLSKQGQNQPQIYVSVEISEKKE